MSLLGHRLVCPHTGQSLAPLSDDTLATSDGLRKYPVRLGVPIVRKGNTHDDGLPFNDLETLVARMQDPDWSIALIDQMGTHIKGLPLRSILASDTVATWQVLLPRSARGRVLYISALLGSEAIALGHWCREVVACDANLTHAALLAARVRQKHLDNVHVVCAGDTDTLPFPDGEFDSVILNGLDWFRDEPDLAAQTAFLCEARRVLKPGGHVWLGVENRWGLSSWIGKPDHYAAMAFFSFLPRSLGDWLAERCRGRRPRAHARGAAGYRRMLGDAGFTTARFHALLPHFRSISELVPLDRLMLPARAASHRSPGLRAKASRGRARLKRTRCLAPTFGIAAHTERSEESWIEALTCSLHQELEIDGPVRFPQLTLSGAASAGLILFLGDAFVLRLPFDPENADRVQRNYLGLEMARDRLRSALQINTPEPLMNTEFDGVPFTVEERIPGVLLSRLDPSRRPTEADRAFELLLAMQALPVERPPDQTALWRDTVATFERATVWAIDAEERKLAADFVAMAADLDASSIPLCLSHGDFHWRNMLVNDTDCGIGLFDWDRWSLAAPATHDFLHFVMIHRQLCGQLSWATAFSDWIAGAGANEQELRWTERFTERAGLVPGWRTPAATHYWSRNITEMAGTDYDLNRSWIRENFLDLLPRMHDLVRAALNATG